MTIAMQAIKQESDDVKTINLLNATMTTIWSTDVLTGILNDTSMEANDPKWICNHQAKSSAN